MQRRLLFFILPLFLLASGCTRTVSLQVLQPAAFKVPEHLQTLATVNRSRPENKVGAVLEGLITGEAVGQDRSGARRATEGLSEALTRTPRFKVVFTSIEMQGKGPNQFPPALPWPLVDSICRSYGADGLAVIEKFDSNTTGSTSSVQRKKKDKEGVETTYLEYTAVLRTRVKLGWRLYDPKNRVILDEFDVWEERGWDEQGLSEQEAQRRLPAQTFTVDETAYYAGIKYGMRIAPTWINVSRSYYPKAKGTERLEADMAEATRLARVDRWRDAARLWQPIAEDKSNPKAAAKACYNMALASEWEGNLEVARRWVQKAWEEYGSKPARTYLATLDRRIVEQQRVDEQMGN
ncbi:MAG: hypothetical protein EAZ89_03615 [Bacteroidetes bacterium]|nr:MAG: hypothetical protein EAZ89_03615 [Bacteroidota bacterium]